MNTFLFALKKELYKLIHKKKYIVFILIGAAVSLIRWGGSALITRITEGHIVVKTNMTLEMLPFAVEILIPIIMFAAAADLFTHEYSADTLKMCLLQPVTRFKLLTAKAAAVMITGAVSLLVMYAANMLIQLISGGSLSQAPVTLAAYLIDIIPLIGVAFFGNINKRLPQGLGILDASVPCGIRYHEIHGALRCGHGIVPVHRKRQAPCDDARSGTAFPHPDVQNGYFIRKHIDFIFDFIYNI